jgi:hypothetical protein
MNQAMIAETLAKINDVLKGGPTLNFGADSLQTMMSGDGVRKDYPSGLVGYDLESAARVLQPVITPLRNRIPRVKGKGGTAANWRQITSLSTNIATSFAAFGSAGATLSYTETDRSATYKAIGVGDNVSIEAIQQALGLEDARAGMSQRLLQNTMILEEQNLITGRNAALGSVTAPTVTSAATGGTVAANTYYVVVRACTGQGVRSTTAANISAAGTIASLGKKSSQTSVTTSGSTSVINATTPYVDGATTYEWYVGTTNNSTSETLEAITQINSVSLAAIAGTGGTIIADNSANSQAFDGFLSQGSGTGTFGNFGYSKVLATGTAGVGTPFQLTDVDTMLFNLWNTYGAIPDALVMAPSHAVDLTAKCRAAGMIRQVVDNGANGKLIGGSRVSGYLHPVVDKELEIIAHPWWPAGSLFALSFKLPPTAPMAETVNAFEVKTQIDYYMLEYAVTAPKYSIEVRCLEALAGYFLLGCGIICNIANG